MTLNVMTLNKEQRRARVTAHRYVKDTMKPCYGCGVPFLPVASRDIKRGLRKTTYATSMFHSEQCEMDYIADAVSRIASQGGTSISMVQHYVVPLTEEQKAKREITRARRRVTMLATKERKNVAV